MIRIVAIAFSPYWKRHWICQWTWYPRFRPIRHFTPRLLVKSGWWVTLLSTYIFFNWSKRPCNFNSFQLPLQRYPLRLWHTTGHHILCGIILVLLCLRPTPKPRSSGERHKIWMIHNCFHQSIWRTPWPTHTYHHQPRYPGNPKACLSWSSLLYPRQFFRPSPNILWGILNKSIMLHTVCPQ